MGRGVTRVLRCSPTVRPRKPITVLLGVTGLWAVVSLTGVLSAALIPLAAGRNQNGPDEYEGGKLVCATIAGVLPLLFAVWFCSGGRRVYWFDRVHGSFTCLRERWRLDRVEWAVPLADVTEVVYHEDHYPGEPTERGVFVHLRSGHRVRVSESEHHASVIAAMVSCPHHRVTRGGMPADQSDSVVGRMSPPSELVKATRGAQPLDRQPEVDADLENWVKECLHCHRPIHAEADVCRHCKRLCAEPGAAADGGGM